MSACRRALHPNPISACGTSLIRHAASPWRTASRRPCGAGRAAARAGAAARRPRADPAGRGAQVQAGQLPATETGTDEKLLELFCAAQPMLCNVRYSVCLSL